MTSYAVKAGGRIIFRTADRSRADSRAQESGGLVLIDPRSIAR